MRYLHNTLSIAATLLALCPATSSVGAAPPAAETCPTVIVPVLSEAPNVDGGLSDAVWQRAARLGPFVNIAGGPAKNQTYARMLRCGPTLYVGFECGLAKGAELKVEQTSRDGDVWTDESVEVFIDPDLTFHKYRHFIVNAANVQRDESGDTFSAPSYDQGWDGTWRSATSRHAGAWYAELAIPFADLDLDDAAPAVIGLNVCRNDQTTGDATCWSPTKSGFHQPLRFGVASLPDEPLSAGVRLVADATAPAGLGRAEQKVTVQNVDDTTARLRGTLIVGDERTRTARRFKVPPLRPGDERTLSLPYKVRSPGLNAVLIAAKDSAGRTAASAKLAFVLPETFRREYGARIPGGEALGLWWAESLHKIHRDKPAPSAARPVRLSAARREYEALQIVVRPQSDVDVSLQVSDFRGTDGRIAAENFRLFEVGYVPVKTPTDKFGWADDWPDPLPPLEGPVHCVAGRNQPFWLLAYVPPDTPAGKYRGRVTVTAGDVRALVPVQLRVWDFTLTPETHTRTAYGVSPDFAFLGVRDRDQQRQVYDLYMQSCRDHRISPYSPMRFYPMDIQLHAPSLKLTCGRLAIEFERGQQHPWKLFWDGEQIATQRTSMTHFEKEGVGWKGTGVSWPYVDAIESVHEVSTTDDMQVLDVVAAHTTSGAAARSFRLTFRFFVPAGDDWFAMRLLQMESTDPTEIEVRNYYNIPRTTFKAESVANGPGFAAWSGDGVGFGMLCLAGNVGGLSIKPGAQGVTVSNSVEPFRIKNGQRHDGWGPLVVYFVTTNTSAEGLAARAAALRQRIDPANPTAYVPSQPVSIAVERRDDYTFTHDFAEFDKGASRYLDEFHFNGFNMRCMPGSIGGHKRFTPEYKRLHRLMYRPVIEHLREKGWLKYAYSYWFDEPSKEDYPHVIEGMKLLGDNCPGLTRLLTEQPEPELEGVIDLWVPVLSMYRPDRCQQRQAAGDQVWWYVCTGPRAPYPNNFVDHPALNHRIRFWMAEKYGVTGSLYWSTTFYGKTPDGQFRNPYLDGMTYRPGGGYWGNGDGMLLYPACTERSNTPVIKGPVVSLRWETLRDGIEDREYFWTLRQEAARLQRLKPKASREKRRDIARALDQATNALGSPDRLADSLIEFDKDPQGLLRERERLARAIEACRRIR